MFTEIPHLAQRPCETHEKKTILGRSPYGAEEENDLFGTPSEPQAKSGCPTTLTYPSAGVAMDHLEACLCGVALIWGDVCGGGFDTTGYLYFWELLLGSVTQKLKRYSGGLGHRSLVLLGYTRIPIRK